MSLSRQRVSLITLGVADLARAMQFYAAWGWSAQADLAADPDGYVWDIAPDPVWPLQPDGSLTLSAG